MRKQNTIQDFWNKVDIQGPDDCWIWSGMKNKAGYGLMSYQGKQHTAHRLSAEFSNNNPKGKFVCHSCDNTSCVNPKHLFLGTTQDNTQDRFIKDRSAKGETIGTSKLTEQQVLDIRYRYSLGNISLRKLAKHYGLGESSIHPIIQRKTWKHI